MPLLVLKQGPQAGRRLTIDAETVVGRRNADVDIDDPLISRRHAVIRPAAGGLEIEDLGSLNGTWVNGERISVPTPLVPGDTITVGATAIEVEALPEEEGRTVIAMPGDIAAAGIAGVAAEPEPLAPLPGSAVGAAHSTEDELRPVTALFADIVGSTSLGERLPPDQVKALVGECVSRMSRVVEQFGGTVQAYMGDGIAAFFGVPSAHEDDPERAARAALRIVDVVGEYAREVEAAWGISNFNARIGINTGETAVGLVGAADPQAVTLGDTPNVAARLQSAAEPGCIMVGQATARALLRLFVLEPLGEVTVKGRTKAVEAWRLVGAQTGAQPEAQTPLVGREPEVVRLTAVLDELIGGRGQLLFMLGDPGIGKSRLVTELRALAAERVTWLEGRCLAYGTETLYGPFLEMLRGWIGVEDFEAELAVRTKLRAKLGLLPASQIPDVLPYLSRLLGLKGDPDTDDALRRLSPEALAGEVRRAYHTWLLALARLGPVVMVVEDVHWADSSTRELAEDLLELADLVPVLIVFTSRIEPTSEARRIRVRVLTDYAHRALELPLGPLSDEAARELLAALPASASLSKIDLTQIVNSAEGNPLYLEELLNAFSSNVVSSGQTWAPTVTGARILTPTLESLLLARIDRLPANARRLAQIAAVIGRSFRLRVLEHVVESTGVDEGLGALLRAEIIREQRGYPEPEYVFRHGLLREACLTTLPPARRRELHGAVGSALEALFATSLDDHLELLAHYFSRSDDLPRALKYLETAGERAAELDAVPSAVELLKKAQKVAEKLGDAAAVQRLGARLDDLQARSSRLTMEAGS